MHQAFNCNYHQHLLDYQREYKGGVRRHTNRRPGFVNNSLASSTPGIRDFRCAALLTSFPTPLSFLKGLHNFNKLSCMLHKASLTAIVWPPCWTSMFHVGGGLSSRLAVTVAWTIPNNILAPHALRSMIGTAKEERCTIHQTPGMSADAAETSWKADIV